MRAAACSLLMLAIALAGCEVPNSGGDALKVPFLHEGEHATFGATFPTSHHYDLTVGETAKWRDRWGRERPVVKVIARGFMEALEDGRTTLGVGVDLGSGEVIQLNASGTIDQEPIWLALYVSPGFTWIPTLWPFLLVRISGQILHRDVPLEVSAYGVPLKYTYVGFQGGRQVIRVEYGLEQSSSPRGPWLSIRQSLLYYIDSTPLPNEIQAPAAGLGTVLRATEHTAGLGEIARSSGPGDHEVAEGTEWTTGPADGNSGMDLTLDEAIQKARENGSAIAYLASHPGAFLVRSQYDEASAAGVLVSASWNLTFGATGSLDSQVVEVTLQQIASYRKVQVSSSYADHAEHAFGDRRLLPPLLQTVRNVRSSAGGYLGETPAVLKGMKAVGS